MVQNHLAGRQADEGGDEAKVGFGELAAKAWSRSEDELLKWEWHHFSKKAAGPNSYEMGRARCRRELGILAGKPRGPRGDQIS